MLLRFGSLNHYGCLSQHYIDLGKIPISYSEVIESMQVRGGQIFWADAYYVRKEMLSSEPVEKQQLLRDIILTKVLGFDDVTRNLQHKFMQIVQ